MSDESNSLLRNFTHITIPAEIWLRRDISMQAKALWAELRSLHSRERGGCYASDDYLMEFMGLKRSRLHEVFKELKDACLMEVVSFNGRQTVRKAIVPEVEYGEVTRQQVSSTPDSRYPENRTATIRKTGSAQYIYNKEENKEDICANSVDASTLISLKKERAKNVTTTDEEHKKLIEKFGAAKTQEGYLDLAEWKESATPSQVKKHSSDYRRLRKWVIPSLDEKKPNTSLKDEFKDKIKDKFKNGEKYNGAECFIDSQGIAFQRGMTHKSVRWTDHGFKEQVLNMLRSFGIQIEI